MDEAVEVLHRCLVLKPDHQKAREYQAQLLGVLGRIEEQYVQLKELLRRFPGSVPGHYQMGVLFLNRGDRAEAFAEYQILQGFEGSPGIELLDLIYPD